MKQTKTNNITEKHVNKKVKSNILKNEQMPNLMF